MSALPTKFPWWWVAVASFAVVLCLASGLVLHFAAGLNTSDSASIVLVLLTIVAIGIAGVAARYAFLSARSAGEAVEPLRAAAATLDELASREEHVLHAL